MGVGAAAAATALCVRSAGAGTMEFPGGEVYIGEWENGMMHGVGRV